MWAEAVSSILSTQATSSQVGSIFRPTSSSQRINAALCPVSLAPPPLPTPPGWKQIPGALDGADGRKVFIRGTQPGSGCWFSTDYLAEDLWVFFEPAVQSTNAFFTSPSAIGPWTNWSAIGLFAPWSPRASAAVASSHRATVAWVASGMKFIDGNPVFGSGLGDVWQVDAGICLLGPANGKVCSGAGTPNLDSVTCACDVGASGKFCEVGKPVASAVAGAILGTLGALGVACAALVFFAPNWGFHVAGRHVVPAQSIKDGAAAVYSGGAWVVSKIAGLFGGGGGGGGGGGNRFASSGYSVVGVSSEGNGLLK